MVIGMLGGSFCPPTTAHLELSKKCIEAGLCDKVVWVPVNDAYKKDTNISAKHRVAMVQLALQNEPNIDYSLHEQKHKDIIRTYESIQELQWQYPHDQLVFIAGADKMGFKWFQREAFVRDFGFIVTNRGDVDCEAMIEKSPTLSKWKNNIKVLNYESDVSSTQVRDQIKCNGHSELVSPEVMMYIKANRLFAD
jgi:nicotinate-nucleotide adenylyltransferase